MYSTVVRTLTFSLQFHVFKNNYKIDTLLLLILCKTIIDTYYKILHVYYKI